MGRRRKNVIAYEIAETLLKYLEQGAKVPKLSVVVDKNIENVRTTVYRELIRKGYGGRVTLTVEGNCILIGGKIENRETTLVNMIKKLMLAVDNETLYEQAYALVHGGTNGK